MRDVRTLKWVIWALAAFFYFYEYLLRVSPSVMVPELMENFHANAAEIGILSAFYFYAYAPMQLPVGMLMDRFGARKLLTLASLICGAGTIFFGISQEISLAYLGRFLIGLGSSFAFVAMVFVCSHWFKPAKRAFLVGLANSIGMLGAVFGQGPLSLMVKVFHWRQALHILGIMGFALAILIFLLVRKSQKVTKESQENQTSKFFEGFKVVTKNSRSWINAIIALLFYMTTTALGGLWGVPFLQSAYHVSKHTASFAMSMLFIGWMIGGPLVGVISDKFGRRKPFLGLGILLTFLALLPVLYLTAMPIGLVYTLIFLVGFFSSAQLLNFTFATELVDEKFKGLSIAFTNLVVAVGSSAIQPLVGFFLDMGTKNTVKNIPYQYSGYDYKIALSILPAMLFLAVILTLFLREKKKTSSQDVSLPID